MITSGPGSLTRAIWHKSSHSNPSGNNCVEVARNLPGVVASGTPRIQKAGS